VPSGSKSRHFKRQASQEFWTLPPDLSADLSAPPPKPVIEIANLVADVEKLAIIPPGCSYLCPIMCDILPLWFDCGWSCQTPNVKPYSVLVRAGAGTFITGVLALLIEPDPNGSQWNALRYQTHLDSPIYASADDLQHPEETTRSFEVDWNRLNIMHDYDCLVDWGYAPDPPTGATTLRIAAFDMAGQVSYVDVVITFCPIPCFGDWPGVARDIAYHAASDTYSVTFRFPDKRLLDLPLHLPDPIDYTLENYVDANLSLRLDQGVVLGDDPPTKVWDPLPVHADVQVVVLDTHLFTYEKDLIEPDRGLAHVTCDNCNIPHTSLGELPSPNIHWDMWPLDDMYLTNIFGVDILASLHLIFDAAVRLSADLGLSCAPPLCLYIGACIVPEAQLVADFILKARALIITVGGGISGTVRAEFPLRAEADSSGLTFNARPCLEAGLGWIFQVCIDLWFWEEWLEERGDIPGLQFETEMCDWDKPGSVDYIPCVRNGRHCVPELESTATAFQLGIPPFVFPTLATSPSRTQAMHVQMEDADPDPTKYRPELFFASGLGGGWSGKQPIGGSTGHTDHDPQVAFLREDNAVLVWTRNELEHDRMRRLVTMEQRNEYLRNEKIYFSFWEGSRGWGSPQLSPTTGTMARGIPKVAAVPGQDKAWATWIQFSEDVFVLDGEGKEGMNASATRTPDLPDA
jgi:hypothetical protein